MLMAVVVVVVVVMQEATALGATSTLVGVRVSRSNDKVPRSV